jgi:ABC-2 type transport system permease protein
VIRLVDAELFKLRTTRTFYAMTGGVIAFELLIVVIALIAGNPTLHDLMQTTFLVQVISLLNGALIVTSEFRHGTITPTLLLVPHRVTLMSSKLLAAMITGLVVGLVMSVIVALLVAAFGEDTTDVVKLIVGSTVATTLFAAFGVGLGTLLRNQVGAIVSSLVYLFVGETVLGVIPTFGDWVAKYGLGGTASALSGNTAENALHQVPAGLVLALWCAVFIVAGFAVNQRRDVTA